MMDATMMRLLEFQLLNLSSLSPGFEGACRTEKVHNGACLWNF